MTIKIWVIGSPGAGKSMLAEKIAKYYGVKYIDLDDIFWLPQWQRKDVKEFKKEVELTLKNSDNWVVAGDYSDFNFVSTYLLYNPIIIWLDYSFLICFWRLLNRTIRRIYFKKPCCNKNTETFTRQFLSKNSIFIWLIKSHLIRRKQYALMLEMQHKNRIFRLRSPNEVQKILLQLEPTTI